MDHINRSSKTLNLCNRFNSLLESILAKKAGHFLIDVDDAMCDAAYFDGDNCLTDYGHMQFGLKLTNSWRNLKNIKLH